MDTTGKLEWLYDRTLISDVLHRFAQNLDTKHWQDWLDLFTEDGVLELPGNHKNKTVLQADGGPKGLMAIHGTHHMSSNHRIDITGDSARTNSYVQAMHVVEPDDEAGDWMVGGWYDHDLRRTADGWKIARVRLTTVWRHGKFPGFGHAHT
ncbi:nuclear transport factor 2 family protein [Amycolatopsis sp. WQ 127309]|uniref:nuclear transport factor 2 family protein n=1 Tax=Amycolatopsis sp. WQ 127309 TaxID=2932773 RepID=UPI001FF38106|nr:nuclear transport factor 2 family protein [Amycolatopsis sp. WQ 127309]UOZ06033.1 nuclear transport factor 2 family protein [Amycolatopsis sp. WQ 127309]